MTKSALLVHRDGKTGKGGRALLVALFVAGCTGQVGDALLSSPTDDPSAAGGGANDGLSAPARFEGHPSALRRLTRDELITTLRALTGQAPARTDLPEEPRSGHGPLLTGGLAFVGPDVEKLHVVIGGFAKDVAPAMLTKSGCTSTVEAQRECLAAWAKAFASSAFRRPARDEEAAVLRTLVATADGTPDADVPAVEGVLEATLFAPSFLYRSPADGSASGPGRRALGPHAIAAQLSYLATLGPPDAELVDAANRGALADGAERVRHLRRLLGTPLGRNAQAVLVLEWLGANEPKLSHKSATYLAGLTADAESAVRSSADRAIVDVLSSGDPSVRHLLTTESFLTDPALHELTTASTSTGVPTGDDAHTGRAGLLMHPQILSAHTKENGASPFQLGSFMREALLCDPVGAPPPGAVDKARKDVPPGLSLREDLQFRISVSPVCTGCHAQFAPLGYSFLPFDPVGRWTTGDPSGKPWDLTGTVATHAGAPLAFSSPRELVTVLSQSPQVHACFAQIALKWSLGRNLVEDDRPLLTTVDGIAARSGGDVAAILEAIVSDPSFITAVVPR